MQTEQINVRIDAPTKIAAEAIFSEIGVSTADAIRMFYRQVIIQRGLPFTPKITDPQKGRKTDRQKIRKIVEASIEKNKVALKDLAGR